MTALEQHDRDPAADGGSDELGFVSLDDIEPEVPEITRSITARLEELRAIIDEIAARDIDDDEPELFDDTGDGEDDADARHGWSPDLEQMSQAMELRS